MKNSYILLRSNEESGPHSLADLERLGLKPNDLIWVEGQSVAWLNPGQLRELKALVVTPGLAASAVTALPSTARENESYAAWMDPGETEQPLAENPSNSPAHVAAKKSVFVSLPASSASPLSGSEKNNGSASTAAAKNAALAVPVEESDNADQLYQPESLETKYAQPLAELKDQYARSLRDRKKKIATRKTVFKAIKIGLVVIVLTGAGAVAGISFYRINHHQAAAKQQVIPPPQQSVTPANQPNTTPETIIPAPADQIPVEKQVVADEIVKQTPGNTPATRNVAVSAKKENAITAISPSVQPVPEQRTTQTRQDEPRQAAAPIGDISSQVSVKTNKYKTGAFGGIRDLQLTVINDSRYVLDNVIVEVEYLNNNDESVKSDRVFFKSVPPNGTQTIAVSKSNRGVKINYRIVRVEPKATAAVASNQ